MRTMPAKYAFEPVIAGTWGNEDKNDENDVICYRAADFDYEHLKVNESAGVVRNIAPSEFVVKALHPGDILIEKSGGGEKTLVGRSVLFDSDKAAVCSNFVSVLRPKSGQSSRYWNYQLAALYSNRGTEPFIKQSTGIQNLDVKAYLSQHVPVRSFEEQERIADELDREIAEIDEFIADQYRLLHLIDEKFKVQLEKLFTENSDSWIRLKRLGITKKSGFSANGTESTADINSEIGVLKTGSVTKGDFLPKENKLVDDPIEINKLQTFVEEGSLIVNRANTKDLVGSIGYAEKNYQNLFLSDLLWSISVKKMNPRIIYFYSKTRHYREQISQIHTGTSSTMQKISYENYKNIKIPVTTTDKQQLQLNIIDEIYTQKKLVFKETLDAINMLNNRKNVIIQFKLR